MANQGVTGRSMGSRSVVGDKALRVIPLPAITPVLAFSGAWAIVGAGIGAITAQTLNLDATELVIGVPLLGVAWWLVLATNKTLTAERASRESSQAAHIADRQAMVIERKQWQEERQFERTQWIKERQLERQNFDAAWARWDADRQALEDTVHRLSQELERLRAEKP